MDNAIHSAAGIQLREECFSLTQKQHAEEKTGSAKITGGYNLPAKYVIHTVGPIIAREVTDQDVKLLSSCYRSCLNKAEEFGLHSIAFCCISTGEFHFPNKQAAHIGVKIIFQYLNKRPFTPIRKVILNVFKGMDRNIYARLLC